MLVHKQEICAGESVFQRCGLNASGFESYADAHQALCDVNPSAGSLHSTYRLRDYDKLNRRGDIKYCYVGTTVHKFQPMFPTDVRNDYRTNWLLAQYPYDIKIDRSGDVIETFVCIHHNPAIFNGDRIVNYVSIDRATGTTLNVSLYYFLYYFEQGQRYYPDMGARFDLVPFESYALDRQKSFNSLNAQVDLKTCKRFLDWVFAGTNIRKEHVEICRELLVKRRRDKGLKYVTYFDLYLTVCVFLDHHCQGPLNDSVRETAVGQIFVGRIKEMKDRAWQKIEKLAKRRSRKNEPSVDLPIADEEKLTDDF